MKTSHAWLNCEVCRSHDAKPEKCPCPAHEKPRNQEHRYPHAHSSAEKRMAEEETMKKIEYPCGCVLEASLEKHAIQTEMAIFCADHAREVEKVSVEQPA